MTIRPAGFIKSRCTEHVEDKENVIVVFFLNGFGEILRIRSCGLAVSDSSIPDGLFISMRFTSVVPRLYGGCEAVMICEALISGKPLAVRSSLIKFCPW